MTFPRPFVQAILHVGSYSLLYNQYELLAVLVALSHKIITRHKKFGAGGTRLYFVWPKTKMQVWWSERDRKHATPIRPIAHIAQAKFAYSTISCMLLSFCIDNRARNVLYYIWFLAPWLGSRAGQVCTYV